MTNTYIREQVQTMPLNDVIMLSTFLRAINKNILESHKATGKYLVVQEIQLNMPECGAHVVLAQDDVTGMVSINRIKNLDVE